MEKQLLTEAGLNFVVDKANLTESVMKEGGGHLLLKGVPATILDKKNANGRIYTAKEVNKSIDTAKKKGLFERRQLNCSADDHPDGSYVKPTHSSHIVLDAYIKEMNGEKYLLNDWLVLATDSGRNLKALIDANASIGTSIRGLGRLNEDTSEVEEYEYLGTDAVGNPSAGTFASTNDFKVEIVSEAVSKSNTQDKTVINEVKKMKFNLKEALNDFKSKYVVENKLSETASKKEAVAELMKIQTEALQEDLDISELDKIMDIVLGEAIVQEKETKDYKKEQTQDVLNKSDRHVEEAYKILATETKEENVELRTRIKTLESDAEQYKVSSKEQIEKIKEESVAEMAKILEEKDSLKAQADKNLEESKETGIKAVEEAINKSIDLTESILEKSTTVLEQQIQKDVDLLAKVLESNTEVLANYMQVTDEAMKKKENIERKFIASLAIIETLQEALLKSYNENEDDDIEVYEDFSSSLKSKKKVGVGEARKQPLGWD